MLFTKLNNLDNVGIGIFANKDLLNFLQYIISNKSNNIRLKFRVILAYLKHDISQVKKCLTVNCKLVFNTGCHSALLKWQLTWGFFDLLSIFVKYEINIL
ncbi:MAG: hypothetical protein DRH21_04470 [Deltaproteobacteria bacterium]|nr:MAG: hypothetical protein DRH21_04470 [Deltaproteobacteria bacterium]